MPSMDWGFGEINLENLGRAGCVLSQGVLEDGLISLQES